MSSEVTLLDALKNGVRFRGDSVNRSIKVKACDGQTDEAVHLEMNATNEARNCALFCHYGQRAFISLHFDLSVPKSVIGRVLRQGLKVFENGRIMSEYAYFGQSASQLRGKTCVLYNKTKLGDYEKVIEHFGCFGRIHDVAKRAARIGLLLSSFSISLDVNDCNIELIDDIEHDDFNFTDGCGHISVDYLQKVAELAGTGCWFEHYAGYCGPSVIQIRLKGCKGVLSASSLIKKEKIEIRRSMEKFAWARPEPYTLGVVDDGMSRPYTYGFLNKQYISILSANGISDDVFVKKQQRYFNEIERSSSDMKIAFRYLCFWGQYDLAERLMKTNAVDKATKSFLDDKKKALFASQMKDSREKKSQAEALKIPIEESRNVFGIADSSGFLESGEAFFQPTIDGKTKILHDTRIVVLKSPCYHPGDIKVLTCVDVPALRHLYDCIVFPTKGSRPHQDEIAGSDLDGDKYFVSWENDLIPDTVHKPTSYQGCKSKACQVTYDKLIDFFVNYNTTLVGMMSNLYFKWADLDGIATPQCVALANLFNRAIDSAKSGESVKIPEELRNAPTDVSAGRSKQPVWLQMAINARNYANRKLCETEEPFKHLEDDELVDLVRNSEVRIDDFKLFRSLYLHLYDNKQHIFEQLLDYISFDHFSQEQLRDIQLDCPKIQVDYFRNVLYRSNILTKEFLSNFRLAHKRNWSLYYSTDAITEVNWDVLNDFFMQSCNKLLCFEFNMAGTRRLIAISVSYSVKLNEYTDAVVTKQSTANVYFAVDDHSGTFYTKNIGEEFTWALDGRCLQIFIGKRQRTFVFLKEEEDLKRTVMSVALDFFNRELLAKYPKLRRDPVVKAEFYSDMGMRKPFFIRPRSSIVDNEPTLSENRESSFKIEPSDFPSLEESLVYERKTRRNEFEQLKDKLNKQINGSEVVEQELIVKCLDILEFDDSIRYEAMDYLVYMMSRGQDLRDSFYYIKTIMSLIEMTPTCLNHKQKWLDKLYTVIDSMQRHKIAIELSNIERLVRKIAFTQSCRGVFAVDFLKTLKCGYFPLTNDSVKNGHYFLHWLALLSIDLVHEIEECEHQSRNAEEVAAANLLLSSEKVGEKYLWNLILRDASLNVASTDVIALTPWDLKTEEPEYAPVVFFQIKKQTGLFLTVESIWPVDCQIKENQLWRADRFPSLITFNRQLDGLRWHVATENKNPLSNFIVSSFDDQQMTPIAGDAEASEPQLIYLQHANESQVAVIRSLPKQSVVLVHGPPGTGKSEVACEIIAQWARDSSVLVVAETNEAVDNVLVKLKNKGFDFDKLIRVGARGIACSSSADVAACTIEKKYFEKYGERKNVEYMDKAKAQQLIRNSRVVFTTCSSSMISFMLNVEFKYLVVDEAAQAFEPAVMMALTRNCQKMCLIGDPCQLPPLVKSPYIKNELSVTLFDRLSKFIEPIMLNTQFRMNPIISRFPSDEFYEGKLIDGVSVDDRIGIPSFKWPDRKRPLVFINVESKEKRFGSSKTNEAEAEFIKYLIETYFNSTQIDAKDVGVITAYSAQVSLLKKLIGAKATTIDTVDGFQGQERELIIFSAVRANDCGDVGFLSDSRRLNVSFTRAKRGLIVLGHEKTLRNDLLLAKWLNWVTKNRLKMNSSDFNDEPASRRNNKNKE